VCGLDQRSAATKIEALLAELKTLRKGLGVQSKNLPEVAGSNLREAAGVHGDDAPGAIRKKVVTALGAWIERLPESRRQTARILFGFDAPADQRYTARLARLGEGADRNMRTMQRRADDVTYLIAEAAYTEPGSAVPTAGRTVHGDGPWHTSALEVSLKLADVGAEVFEMRRIVSHVPGLDEIDHSVSLAKPAPSDGPPDLLGLGIDVVAGGEVHSARMVSSTRVAFRLRPPRVLNVGDEHEFFFRIRVPALLAPFYCCTPEFACERFDLNIRFPREHLPGRAWRIDGELSRDAEDPLPVRAPLTANSAGEVRVGFRNLRPARSYGIGWQLGAD